MGLFVRCLWWSNCVLFLAEKSECLLKKRVIQFRPICAVSRSRCSSSTIFSDKAVVIPRSRSTLHGKPVSSISRHHFLNAFSTLDGSFYWSWFASRLFFLALNRWSNVDTAISNSSVKTDQRELYSALFDSARCIKVSLSCCDEVLGCDFPLTIFGCGFVITMLIFFTGMINCKSQLEWVIRDARLQKDIRVSLDLR